MPTYIPTYLQNNPATDWNVFAEKAIAAIGKEVPEYHGLFFVEGVEGSAMYQRYPHWWGGKSTRAPLAPLFLPAS